MSSPNGAAMEAREGNLPATAAHDDDDDGGGGGGDDDDGDRKKARGLGEDDVHFSYLSLTVLADRLAVLATLSTGGRVGFFSGHHNVSIYADCQELRPTWLIATPKVLAEPFSHLLGTAIQNASLEPDAAGEDGDGGGSWFLDGVTRRPRTLALFQNLLRRKKSTGDGRSGDNHRASTSSTRSHASQTSSSSMASSSSTSSLWSRTRSTTSGLRRKMATALYRGLFFDVAFLAYQHKIHAWRELREGENGTAQVSSPSSPTNSSPTSSSSSSSSSSFLKAKKWFVHKAMQKMLRRLYWQVFDRVAFSSTRSLLGGRIRCFIVIAAPHLNFMPPPIVEFLATAFDCPVYKSIVIPEASGYATWCDVARDIYAGENGNSKPCDPTLLSKTSSSASSSSSCATPIATEQRKSQRPHSSGVSEAHGDDSLSNEILQGFLAGHETHYLHFKLKPLGPIHAARSWENNLLPPSKGFSSSSMDNMVRQSSDGPWSAVSAEDNLMNPIQVEGRSWEEGILSIGGPAVSVEFIKKYKNEPAFRQCIVNGRPAQIMCSCKSSIVAAAMVFATTAAVAAIAAANLPLVSVLTCEMPPPSSVPLHS